jgi:hypothetical protein
METNYNLVSLLAKRQMFEMKLTSLQFQNSIFEGHHTSKRRTHERGAKYALSHTLHGIQCSYTDSR